MIEPLWSTARVDKPSWAWFDEEEAKLAVQFFLMLQHTLGEWAGKPFVPSPEQEWLTREMFGWKRADGTRLYRTGYVETGRGWGKSEYGAAVAGKLLYADREQAAEVIGAAADREQARSICLERLKGMAGAYDDASTSPLKSRSHFLRREIRVPRTNSAYKAVSADVATKWGAAPSGVIFDEVHAQPDRRLWDALVTATGKRRQPLVLALTTAGWDRSSLAWELHDYAVKIAKGEVQDPTFLGVIWAAPEDADWTDENVWRQANPHLGVTVPIDFLRAECERAKSIPAFQNTFRTMYLSQWVGQESRLIPMVQWDQCAEPIAAPSKAGAAFGGLDLSSTTDLTAFSVIREVDGKVEVWRKVYVPEDALRERGLRDRAPYESWARDGLITPTPGKTVDYAAVKRDVLWAKDAFNLRDVGYDRWNSSQVVRELEDEGVRMVQVGQGYASMSAPTKELLRRVADQGFRHGGDPVLRWMTDNCAAETDASGNLKLAKNKSSGRIDALVSTVIALDGWMRRGRRGSRYSEGSTSSHEDQLKRIKELRARYAS